MKKTTKRHNCTLDPENFRGRFFQIVTYDIQISKQNKGKIATTNLLLAEFCQESSLAVSSWAPPNLFLQGPVQIKKIKIKRML